MWTSEALLTVIYQASPRDCVTEERMAELTGRTASAIANSCHILRKNKLLTRTAKGCHKLTEAGRAAVEQGASVRPGGKGEKRTGHVHHKDSMRADAWLAMRVLRKFSVADLVMRLPDRHMGQKDIEKNLRNYCRLLIRAGYLVELPLKEVNATTARGSLRYRLLDEMDTGPLPIVPRDHYGTVYDHNTEREIKLKEAK